MRLDVALARLKRPGARVLRTADVVGLLDIRADHASHVLARLAESGHLVRLKRGLWAFAEAVEAHALSAHLAAPLPSYVSLQSGLYFHGMISQIPEVTYAVTLGRTRVYETAAGTFSFHHVARPFFFGWERVGETRMATPEKALVDVLYLSQARSGLFAALPEVELIERFDAAEAERIVESIGHTVRRAHVMKRLEDMLSGAQSSGRSPTADPSAKSNTAI